MALSFATVAQYKDEVDFRSTESDAPIARALVDASDRVVRTTNREWGPMLDPMSGSADARNTEDRTAIGNGTEYLWIDPCYEAIDTQNPSQSKLIVVREDSPTGDIVASSNYIQSRTYDRLSVFILRRTDGKTVSYTHLTLPTICSV